MRVNLSPRNGETIRSILLHIIFGDRDYEDIINGGEIENIDLDDFKNVCFQFGVLDPEED